MSTAVANVQAELRGLVQNVRGLIEERGTTRHAVAKAAGIDDTSFYRKLDRNPQAFTTGDLLGIAAALGVNPSELWAEAGAR